MIPIAPIAAPAEPSISYRYVTVDHVRIFYREAGSKTSPTIVLLHGFPSSSHMYRNLIPLLAPHYHIIAPDYPGFGNSDMPSRTTFAYTFDHLAAVMTDFLDAINTRRFALYMQDFGGPVGLRIAAAHPSWISGLIVQNANAYQDGLLIKTPEMEAFWKDRAAEAPVRGLLTLDAVKFQYLHGALDPEKISPDAYDSDYAFVERPGAKDIQLDLLYDYQNNFPKYGEWQAYFRAHQPPTLIVWGENDPFFSVAGANGYRHDLKNAEFHFFPTGHFALEEYCGEIAGYIDAFQERLTK
jgi:pimeloyl-ACP methyl ester carboxylesterase